MRNFSKLAMEIVFIVIMALALWKIFPFIMDAVISVIANMVKS